MHPDTVQVAKHMRDYGLSVLGRAVADTTFNEMMRPFAHPMAVTLAAHDIRQAIPVKIDDLGCAESVGFQLLVIEDRLRIHR